MTLTQSRTSVYLPGSFPPQVPPLWRMRRCVHRLCQALSSWHICLAGWHFCTSGDWCWSILGGAGQVHTYPTGELPWTVGHRSFCPFFFPGSEWPGIQCQFAGIVGWECSGRSALLPKDNIRLVNWGLRM